MSGVISKHGGTLALVLATAIAAGLVALAPATAASGDAPFEARLAGTAVYTTPTTVAFHSAGNATHLGRFAAGGVAALGPPAGSCPDGATGIPNVHTETFTASDGDELVIRMVNVGCPTGPSTFHGSGHWAVVGGTGRFADVTGSGTCEGNADFATGTFELALSGALNRR